MSLTKENKKDLVGEIKDNLKNSKSLVIAEYHGLTVGQIEQLRTKLREKDVKIKVYKNRLFKIASMESGFNFENELVGPNIYAFGMSDEIAPAKIINNFAKENEALKIKAGIYENKVIFKDEVMQIAALPSFEEALELLARTLIAPLHQVSMGLKMSVDEGKINK
jgi:large subunit ribosomal protein L10